MKLTPEQLAEMPIAFLDRMSLPRGKFSPEEQAAARQEIKRRFGMPVGSIVMPPREEPLPDSATLRAVPGGGWIFMETEKSDE